MSYVQLFPTHMLSLETVLGFCHGIAKGGDCKVEFNQSSQSQVTRTPCLGKTDFSHSFLTLLYIDPYTHEMLRASRENFKRKTLKKNKMIHPQSSHRDSSNSSTLFLSIVKSLRGTLPKPLLTIPISVKRLFGTLRSS